VFNAPYQSGAFLLIGEEVVLQEPACSFSLQVSRFRKVNTLRDNLSIERSQIAGLGKGCVIIN